jgi:hypothetical protein
VVLALVVAGAAPWVSPLHAQTAYKAANAPTSVVPRSSGFIHADFAEARLTVHYVHEFLGAGIGLAPYAGAAARKGQVDLFSAFDFNPGFEAGVLGFASLGGGTGSLNVVSFAVGYQRTERKVIEFSDDSSTVSFSEPAQSDLMISTGLNVVMRSNAVIGLGGSLRREWSSPGVTDAVEVCVAVSGPGALNVPLCSDRYAVPLADYWAGQVRADLLWNARRLSTARSQPHLAALGSVALDLGQDADPRLNVGIGIGVTPAQYPGHLIVALFFELYDVLDAGGIQPSFADQFVTRVVLGVPFDLLVN